jgi:hypothetical protein
VVGDHAAGSTATAREADTCGAATEVAVMTTWPYATPVTRPPAETVATAGFDDCHVTAWLACAGSMLATSEVFCPIAT